MWPGAARSASSWPFWSKRCLLLLLLTLGREEQPGVEEDRPTVVSLIAPEISQDAPEARKSEPEQRAEAQRERQRPEPEAPRPPQPAEPAAAPAAPAAPAILPMRWSLSPSTASSDRPAPPARPLYGPPDNRSAAMRDTERVGTAPNGEPLYAAQWYREPAGKMMRAYLSTARGPGWGLIACRTAPDYRVEDCVALKRISRRIADQSLSARHGVGIQGATSATGRTATGGLLGQDQDRLRPWAALAPRVRSW